MLLDTDSMNPAIVLEVYFRDTENCQLMSDRIKPTLHFVERYVGSDDTVTYEGIRQFAEENPSFYNETRTRATTRVYKAHLVDTRNLREEFLKETPSLQRSYAGCFSRCVPDRPIQRLKGGGPPADDEMRPQYRGYP
jgi:hypothetical protein